MAKVKTHKIVSTLSAPVGFTVYETDAQGNKSPVRKVLIGGGANVWDGVIVPSGYGTLVSDEELAILRENSVFCAFEKEGGIVVASLKDNQDKVIENMAEKDASAQRTPADIENPNVKVANKNGEVVVEMPEEEEQRENITVSSKKARKGRPSKK